MPRQFGPHSIKRRRRRFGDVLCDVAEDRKIPEYVTSLANSVTLSCTLQAKLTLIKPGFD